MKKGKIPAIILTVAMLAGAISVTAGAEETLDTKTMEVDNGMGYKMTIPNFAGESGVLKDELPHKIETLPGTLSVFLLDDEASALAINLTFDEYIDGKKLYRVDGRPYRSGDAYSAVGDWPILFIDNSESPLYGWIENFTFIKGVNCDRFAMDYFEYDSEGMGNFITRNWFRWDYILLTPSMADEYLEKGTIDYYYEIYGDEVECGTITIEVPGLREIILSARGLLKNWAGTGSATFIIRADRVDFVKLLLDGEPVDESFYKIIEGSTIIELSEEYLKTLDKGEHKFTAEFKDGVEFDFFVAISDTGAPETPESVPETPESVPETPEEIPESVPETGIGSNVAIWITIACISALGITGVSALYLKGKRQRAGN